MSQNNNKVPWEQAWNASYKMYDKAKFPIWYGGSLRRKCNLVGDLDLVIPEEYLGEAQTTYGSEIDGLKIEWYPTKMESLGAMLLHATGSKNMNIIMRRRAQERGMLLNQFGLFKDGKMIAGHSEAGIFKALNMNFKMPEERNY